MIQVLYNRWNKGYCEIGSSKNTLSSLDGYNDTKYARRKNSEQYLEEASCKFHNERKIYFVTILQDKKPVNFLNFNRDFILVGFLDELRRQYLDYVFSEYEPGKVFLKEAQYWDHKDDTDEKIFSTRYFFKRTGEVKIEKADLVTRKVWHSNPEIIDVSANHDTYPDFGKYESLIEKERISKLA